MTNNIESYPNTCHPSFETLVGQVFDPLPSVKQPLYLPCSPDNTYKYVNTDLMFVSNQLPGERYKQRSIRRSWVSDRKTLLIRFALVQSSVRRPVVWSIFENTSMLQGNSLPRKRIRNQLSARYSLQLEVRCSVFCLDEDGRTYLV